MGNTSLYSINDPQGGATTQFSLRHCSVPKWQDAESTTRTITTMRILTLCGSLRARSSNRALLRAYERLAPSTVTFEHYDRASALPHFNPDADGATMPPDVALLRSAVAAADAVVISTPEYAHALPGSFKNALDWLVSAPPFAGKAVAILHASRGSTWALDSLREVLKTMSARIIEPASALLPLGSNQLDAAAILAHEDLRRLLLGSLHSLISEVEENGTRQAVDRPTLIATVQMQEACSASSSPLREPWSLSQLNAPFEKPTAIRTKITNHNLSPDQVLI